MWKNKKKKLEAEEPKIETVTSSRSRRTPKPNPKYASDEALLAALKISAKDAIGSSTEEDELNDFELDETPMKFDKNKKRIKKKISIIPKSEPVRKLRDRNSSQLSTDVKANKLTAKNLTRSKLLYDLSSPGKDDENDTDTENILDKELKTDETNSDDSETIITGRGRPRKSLLGVEPRETRQRKKGIHDDVSNSNAKKSDTITIVNVDDIINSREIESAKQAAKKNLSNILERKRYFHDNIKNNNNNNTIKKLKLDNDSTKNENNVSSAKKSNVSSQNSSSDSGADKKDNLLKLPEKRTYYNKSLNSANKLNNRPDIKIEEIKVIQSSTTTNSNRNSSTTKTATSKQAQQPVRILNSTLKSRNMGSPTVKLSNSTSGKIYSIDLTETGEILVDDKAKKIIPLNKSNNSIILNSSFPANRNALKGRTTLPSSTSTITKVIKPGTTVTKTSPIITRQVTLSKGVPSGLTRVPSIGSATSATESEEEELPVLKETTVVEKWSVLAIPPIVEKYEKYSTSFSLIKLGNEIKKIKLPSSDWHYKIFLQKLDNKNSIDIKKEGDSNESMDVSKEKVKKAESSNDSIDSEATEKEDNNDSMEVENDVKPLESIKTEPTNDEKGAPEEEKKSTSSEKTASDTKTAETTKTTAATATTNVSEEVYTGEVQDNLIKDSEKHKYEPSNISFRRSSKNAGAANNKRQIQYDRSVTFKNKTFYLNIEGKNCKLLGCSGHIDSLEDIEYLLDILNHVNLSHSCVEVCNVL